MMSPDLAFWLGLALKLAITASFVILALVAAERGGPLVGAMIASLPVSVGPSYVFLALDHDTSFIAAGALASLVANAATCLFALAYTVVAQRHGATVSLAAALAAWAATMSAVMRIEWTFLHAVVLTAAVFAVALPLSSRFRHAPMHIPARRWYDVPLRASLVALLVCLVVTLSTRVGPVVSGALAVFPVVFTSLILILHPRVGGRANAAVIANALSGMIGYAMAISVLHLTAVPLGAPLALTLALAVAIGWNLLVWNARQRGIPI
jgi:hypothetical protein